MVEATATYTKLRSGAWGIRLPYRPEAGQEVEVTTKEGKRKHEKVLKVLWHGDGIYLCAIAPHRHGTSASRGGCACNEQRCCRPRCYCTHMCACKGGPVYDCLG